MSQQQVRNNRAELKRLRAENAELHKIVIDAKAILSTEGAFSLTEVLELLDTAPEPSDEAIAAIEAGDEESA